MTNRLMQQRGWLLMVAALALGIIGVLAALTTTRAKAVTATLPAGTQVTAALERTISTGSARVGDEVTLTTRAPIRAGEDAIPAGAILHGEVTRAKGGGRIAGAPELTIRVTSLTVDGDRTPITTVPFRFRGPNDAKESVLAIVGGTVAGGVLGQVLGKKALEGAVIGAAAGTAVAVATKGDQIVLPAGVKLRVRLTEPVRVTFRPAPDQGAPDSPGS